LQPWQIIVYESTVYPGCTEEICLPILEKFSNLKCPKDFKIGYSPERINPWDKKHTVENIVKVVAGIDSETTDFLANEIYWKIIKAGVHKAPSIKVAEAAKVIENTQRDINIALMNELSQIFDKIWINTYDVLEAAWTKWNFLKFTPGLVWWHCIGVDPYWLAYKAVEVNHHPELILAWRRINDYMPIFVANQVVKLLIKAGKKVEWANILILWLTFKENVPDFRNSKIADVIKELKDFWVKVNAYDPFYTHLNNYILNELNLLPEEVLDQLKWKYDGIVYAVDHEQFKNLDLEKLLDENWILFDVKGKFRNRWFKFYKSL
jgi:UDP-N-acetyl-D-galactosamine dehydrogenase